MTKKMKRPISNITQDSIKPSLSNAVEFYTNKNREAHKCIQERDEYIDYLESKLSNEKPQQALPVVPECVGDYISGMKEKGENITFAIMCSTYNVAGEGNAKAIHWKDSNPEDFARAWLDGYTVEKPQLFYIELPNVYGLKNKIFVSKVENGTIVEFSNGKNYALKFTEQEIKSIDERYWQFAVPVEDGE
ncbi:hypothetical protein V425_09840 [Lactococcus lactis RTB018]|nr:DUF1642 domain-containing protein [Lactococcus lactis]OAZ16031.1 hypothetical protein V425_09840 [Lactococcus lactis RTB018]